MDELLDFATKMLHIEVAGTVASAGPGEIAGENDPYKQTLFVLGKIRETLRQAGASLSDVVRTRIFVTDIAHWEDIGRAHGEFFREIKPVSTMVQVSALIAPGFLVEIEATAIVADRGQG